MDIKERIVKVSTISQDSVCESVLFLLIFI